MLVKVKRPLARMNPDFQKLMTKCRDVLAGGHDAWSIQSTGERLAVALVLDRHDWLHELGFTIAQAIDRIGPVLRDKVPLVAEDLFEEGAL